MKHFNVNPAKVLDAVRKEAMEVVVVHIDLDGKLRVSGSTSTPVTLALLRQGIREIDRLSHTTA